MKKEKSCGNIVFKKENGVLKVLLIHHNLGHYGMPKGHVELGETEEETALREVFEETGISSYIIDGFREMITYSPKENVIKDVIYFVGEANDFKTTPQIGEVSEAFFTEADKAVELVTHEEEKKVLEKAIEFYKGLER